MFHLAAGCSGLANLPWSRGLHRLTRTTTSTKCCARGCSQRAPAPAAAETGAHDADARCGTSWSRCHRNIIWSMVLPLHLLQQLFVASNCNGSVSLSHSSCSWRCSLSGWIQGTEITGNVLSFAPCQADSDSDAQRVLLHFGLPSATGTTTSGISDSLTFYSRLSTELRCSHYTWQSRLTSKRRPATPTSIFATPTTLQTRSC